MNHEKRSHDRRVPARTSTVAVIVTAAAALGIGIAFGDWHARAAVRATQPEEWTPSLTQATPGVDRSGATATYDASVPSAANVLDQVPTGPVEPAPTF
ncbi:MAG: hypothetical protein ABJA61_00265 [Caldimonas sp.]